MCRDAPAAAAAAAAGSAASSSSSSSSSSGSGSGRADACAILLLSLLSRCARCSRARAQAPPASPMRRGPDRGAAPGARARGRGLQKTPRKRQPAPTRLCQAARRTRTLQPLPALPSAGRRGAGFLRGGGREVPDRKRVVSHIMATQTRAPRTASPALLLLVGLAAGAFAGATRARPGPARRSTPGGTAPTRSSCVVGVARSRAHRERTCTHRERTRLHAGAQACGPEARSSRARTSLH